MVNAKEMEIKENKESCKAKNYNNIWNEGDEQAQMLSCDQRFGLNVGGSCHWVDELLFRKIRGCLIHEFINNIT
jgi:hypothetical protein